jgi:hypothetical protein
LQETLWQADLAKFARAQPGADDAAAYLADARELLTRWHQAGHSAGEVTDAVR